MMKPKMASKMDKQAPAKGKGMDAEHAKCKEQAENSTEHCGEHPMMKDMG